MPRRRVRSIFRSGGTAVRHSGERVSQADFLLTGYSKTVETFHRDRRREPLFNVQIVQ